MKVLTIFASPRKNGNIARMLSAAEEGAQMAGHEVVRVNLYDHPLLQCTGCMACRKTGLCPLPDELGEIREALYGCGAVVLAAPTYFANVPGPVKTLFDRMAGAVMDEGPTGIPKGKLSRRQKYLLLTACTTPAPFDRLCGQSTGALRAMGEFFKTAGMRPMGSFVFAGSKGRTTPEKLLTHIRRCWDR